MREDTTDRYLLVIAGFKLFKGFVLMGLAVGALGLLHKDAQDIFENWIELLHFDPNNRHLAGVLAKIGLLDDKRIEEISALTFFYSAVFLTEGVGLMLKKQWAKYFTVIVSASLIPLELFSLAKHYEVKKIVLIAINIAIIWFLIAVLRRARPSSYIYRPRVLFK